MLGVKGIVPSNVIINGVLNDPRYDQWEVIFKESGFPYNNPEWEMIYVEEYRSFMDQIDPTDNPILRFISNQTKFFPGDQLNVNLRIKYYGTLPSADLYVALTAFGNLYFYPEWTKDPSLTTLTLDYGFDKTFELLKDISISESIPEGTYSLLSVTTEPGTTNFIGNVSQFDFKVTHQRLLIAYFKDNPVYKNPEDESWTLTIYIENMSDFDISMNEFVGETFDSDGNKISSDDLVKEFHKWFQLLGRKLSAGEKAEASISVKLGDNESGGVEFYFMGKDENGTEIEAKTERLQLLTAQ